jgi:hypothetical protein
MAGREQNRIETVGNFFSFTPTEGNFLQIFKQGVFGSIASLGVVILEKQFGKYLYQSGGGLPNRLTFAGSFLVDNLRGFVGGFLSMLDRKAEKSDPVAQEKSLKSEAQTKAENIYNQGRMTEASPVPYENLEKSDSAIEQSGWGDVMGGDVANLFKEFTVDGGQSQGGAESGWASSKEVGSQGVYMTGGAETLFSFGKSFLSKISLTEGSESMGSVESDALGYGFSPLEKTEVGSNPLVTKIDQATNLNISDKFLLSATLPRLSAEQTVFLVNHMEAIVAGSVRLAGGTVGMNGVGEPVLAFDLDVAKVDKGSQLGNHLANANMDQPDGRVSIEFGLESGKVFAVFAFVGTWATVRTQMGIAGSSSEAIDRAAEGLKVSLSESALKDGKIVWVARVSLGGDGEGWLAARGVSKEYLSEAGQAMAGYWDKETADLEINIRTGAVTTSFQLSKTDLENKAMALVNAKVATDLESAMKQVLIEGNVNPSLAGALVKLGPADTKLNYQPEGEGKDVKMVARSARAGLGMEQAHEKMAGSLGEGSLKDLISSAAGLRATGTTYVSIDEKGQVIPEGVELLSRLGLKAAIAGTEEGTPLKVLLERILASGAEIERLQMVVKNGSVELGSVVFKGTLDPAKMKSLGLSLTQDVKTGPVVLVPDGNGGFTQGNAVRGKADELLQRYSNGPASAERRITARLVSGDQKMEVTGTGQAIGRKEGLTFYKGDFSVVNFNGDLVHNGNVLGVGGGDFTANVIAVDEAGNTFIVDYTIKAGGEGVDVGNQKLYLGEVNVKGGQVAAATGREFLQVMADGKKAYMELRVTESTPVVSLMSRGQDGEWMARSLDASDLANEKVEIKMNGGWARIKGVTAVDNSFPIAGARWALSLTDSVNVDNVRTLTTVIMNSNLEIVGQQGVVKGPGTILDGAIEVKAKAGSKWSMGANGIQFEAGVNATVSKPMEIPTGKDQSMVVPAGTKLVQGDKGWALSDGKDLGVEFHNKGGGVEKGVLLANGSDGKTPATFVLGQGGLGLVGLADVKTDWLTIQKTQSSVRWRIGSREHPGHAVW